MPDEMFLRSGPDWHLDAAGVATFEHFLEDRGIAASDVDPVPIGVFLEYASWFCEMTGVCTDERHVCDMAWRDGVFDVAFDDGSQLTARSVVAAVGVRHFRQFPGWAAHLAPGVAAHTCDLVDFEALRGARVLIIGGRQSAYEWAALAGEHGAERIDIVHRHPVPRFERVSWAFTDEYVEATRATPGWWRTLSAEQREHIGRRFWEVGRLTLEWWLVARLARAALHRWPDTSVVEATPRDDGVDVALSNGERRAVDRVVFATGYRAEVASVPHLAGGIDDVEVVDGFPVLDTAFQSTRPGLYLPGFTSTRDFGPLFGFTKGCPATAQIIVDDLLRRA